MSVSTAPPDPDRRRRRTTLHLLAAIAVVAAGIIIFTLACGRPSSVDVYGKPDVASPVRSATVSLQKSGGTAQAVVENLGDQPIEAYTITVWTEGVLAYQVRRDECCLTVDPSVAVGGIALHDRRIVQLSNITPGANPVLADNVSLALVVLADQSFEGSRNSRAELAAHREAAIADLDCWIAAVDESQKVPAGDITARFTAKILDCSRAPGGPHLNAGLFGLPALASQAGQSPGNYAATAKDEKDRLLAQRAAIAQRVPR